MKPKSPHKLSNIIQFNPTERLAKGTLAKKVPMEYLQPYTRAISDYETAEYSGGSKFRNGDTLMARITPCLENGKTAYASILDDGEVGFGSTEYIVFRNIEGVTDSKFVYYFVTSPWFREIAIKSMVGSSGRQRVQQSVLENLEVTLPPLEEQRRIAGILGSLDDKIELNRRINANLEAQAQALFINISRTCPTQKGILKDLIEIKYGKDHKKLNVGNIPVYGSGGIMRYVDTSIYEKETVLIPRKGSLNNVIYLNTPFWSVDTMFYSVMKYDHIAKYVYFFLKSKDLSAMNAGSAVPSMTTDILYQMEINIPDKTVFETYDTIVSPLFKQIQVNQEENQSLSALRDTLLPKLMAGEITLK